MELFPAPCCLENLTTTGTKIAGLVIVLGTHINYIIKALVMIIGNPIPQKTAILRKIYLHMPFLLLETLGNKA